MSIPSGAQPEPQNPQPQASQPAPSSPPAQGQQHTVRSIHYTLSYVAQNAERGPKGAIVLLHDLPGGAFVWDAVMPPLAGTGRAVYAFDMLGFGQSDHPWPSDTSSWGQADCLSYALEALNLTEIVLVGHGLGGAVAQVLATRLARARVARLALINSYAYQHAYAADWPLSDMEKRHDPDLPRQTKLADLISELRAKVPVATTQPIGQARLDAYSNEWNSHVGLEMLYQHIRLMKPDYINAVASDVKALQIPIMLLWGGRDQVTPPALGQRIAAENPHATFQRITEAGHLILDDAAPAVAQALSEFAAR
ncbi:MAG TPA: alpha/beta hydrolase [Ktedonobacterales bacterium]